MDQKVSSSLIYDAVSAARDVASRAALQAQAHDHDGGFPHEALRDLASAGLLAAPVPKIGGGAGLGEELGSKDLLEVLRLVGGGSLALGRIYEGHVNALQLIARFGDIGQRQRLFADAVAGHLFGVWNTEPSDRSLTIADDGAALRLSGVKTYASGAGFVTRALVTARRSAGAPPLMLVVPLESGRRADLTSWKAHGMRASATGTLDFTGLTVSVNAVIGGPDDYHRQPFFSGGAWRFAAVQLGGIEAVFDAWRRHIAEVGRDADPHQLARIGEGAIAVETARLWVERAAAVVAEAALSPERIVALVNLARLAVERAGLDVLELAHRSVGLQGFLRSHPLERLSRDLATYLRQPASDRALTSAAAEILCAAGGAGELWQP